MLEYENAPRRSVGLERRMSFREFFTLSRANLKSRRGVLLTCAKMTETRVPFYQIDEDGVAVWPTTWQELRDNLRHAHPAALNTVDPYAMWTQTDILRAARQFWDVYEDASAGPYGRALNALQKKSYGFRRRVDVAKEARDARQNFPRVDVDEWVRIGAPHLDDVLPLHELTKTPTYLRLHGPDAPARCNQIAASEFMARCVGRADLPRRGMSIYAGQALDKIPGWLRGGMRRHQGSVWLVWRREGSAGEFSLVKQPPPQVEQPAARRRVM